MTTRRGGVKGPSVPRAVAEPSIGGPPAPVARVFLSTDVRCSYCDAQPGEKCRDRDTGKPATISHNSRAEKAERLTLQWRAWHGDKAASARVPPL